jgi:hypothetical protein
MTSWRTQAIEARKAAGRRPVYHIEHHGRLGNRMIQHMVALKFQSLVPGCLISNADLPIWGIRHPPLDMPGPVAEVRTLHQIDLAGLAARIASGEIRSVLSATYGQRMENFLDVDAYRAVFQAPADEAAGFDETHLVCPVRAGDILHGGYPEYPLVPVEFYADLVAETGLRPVFLGETEPNPYTDRLRARFPQAIFLPPGGVLRDFETIRRSRNIVVGVSTFSWVAAWLSHAERVFLAVSGLFNPRQYPPAMLLPFEDPRYRFYLFPVNFGVALANHADVHDRMSPHWRLMQGSDLRRLIGEAPRFERTLEMMLSVFDAEHYLGAYPKLAPVYPDDPLGGVRHHYENHGFHELRSAFRFAEHWYAATYPMAAFEVAQGDYVNLEHHFAAVGRARGCRPHP